MELSCLHKDFVNCCQGGNCSDNNCPDTHTCCWEKTKSPTLGHCVLKDSGGGKGFCDYSRGLPKKGCKDQKNDIDVDENFENINVKSKEGYHDEEEDCDCNNWENGFKVVCVILFILAILVLCHTIKNKIEK